MDAKYPEAAPEHSYLLLLKRVLRLMVATVGMSVRNLVLSTHFNERCLHFLPVFILIKPKIVIYALSHFSYFNVDLL